MAQLLTALPNAIGAFGMAAFPVTGAATPQAALADASDASYVRGASGDYVVGGVAYTIPARPAGHTLHRYGVALRYRRPMGYRYANTLMGNAGFVLMNATTLNWTDFTGWFRPETLLTSGPGGDIIFGTAGTAGVDYVDFSRAVAQYDWRVPPAFVATVTAGTGRNPLVQATGIDLDGLDPRQWSVDIEGPMSFSYSGTGAWPAVGVTVDECPDGNYTATVTISSSIANGLAFPTTQTVAFTIASPDPLSYLQDTAFVGSLAAHFDMACNSVAGVWYCDAAGVIQFRRRPPADYAAHFSDVRDTTDPLNVCYTGIGLSYDTRNVVNDLADTNHGTTFDAGSGQWVAADTTYAVRDATSVASWGQRSDSIDTCIYDVSGSLAKRVAALLEKYSAPAIAVQSVTFNTDAAPWAALLDLYTKVQVTRSGVTYGAVVVGITHRLATDRWLTTYTLMKD